VDPPFTLNHASSYDRLLIRWALSNNQQVFHQAMDDWHNRTPSLASSAASMQSAKDPPRPRG